MSVRARLRVRLMPKVIIVGNKNERRYDGEVEATEMIRNLEQTPDSRFFPEIDSTKIKMNIFDLFWYAPHTLEKVTV